MSQFQNVTITICHKLRNVTITKCHNYKMSQLQNVTISKCHNYKMSQLQNVTTDKIVVVNVFGLHYFVSRVEWYFLRLSRLAFALLLSKYMPHYFLQYLLCLSTFILAEKNGKTRESLTNTRRVQ